MKDKLSLMLLIGLPTLFFVILVGMIYLPRTWAKPEYNYLYSKKDGCGYIDVVDGQLDTVLNSQQYNCSSDMVDNKLVERVYYHDVETNSSSLISLEKAKEIDLNSDPESPDGFRLKESNGNNGGIFGGSSGRKWSLVGKGASIPQDLDLEEYYYGDVEFLGWENNN